MAYFPALRAGFIWDDHALTDYAPVAEAGGLAKIWLEPSLNAHEAHYWPLVYTTFWLEHRLWGLHPFGYHLDNILLHGLCAALVWRLLRRLKVPGAWLAGALFALHPVHVESVAWVIERKDVLSGALYLGAALAYLRFECGMRNAECGIGNQGIQNTESRIQNSASLATRHSPLATYILAIVLFAGALLSKSIVVTLPVALGLMIWWHRGRLGWRDGVRLLPFALLGLAVTLADYSAMAEKPILDIPFNLTRIDSLRLAGQSLWFYLGKLAWPHPLAATYPKWDLAAGGLGGWLPLAAAGAAAAVLWAGRRRLGRGPFFAFVYFAVTLAPVLGLVKFGFLRTAWVADRFLYLASIGPLALAAAGLTQWSRLRPSYYSAFRIALSALLLVLAVLTWRQADLYRDNIRLSQDSVTHYPDNWIAWFFLGAQYDYAQRDEEAIHAMGEALRLNPDAPYLVPIMLANNQAKLGRAAEAEKNFRIGVARGPDYAKGRDAYGLFLAGQGRNPEAIAQYLEALRIHPQYDSALNNLGTVLFGMGRHAEAAKRFGEAAAAAPDVAMYHANLGAVLLELKQTPAAIAELREALRLDPDHALAQMNLGLALLGEGDASGAAGHLEAAARLQPDNAFIQEKLDEARRKNNEIK